jgi:hypothetical protein
LKLTSPIRGGGGDPADKSRWAQISHAMRGPGGRRGSQQYAVQYVVGRECSRRVNQSRREGGGGGKGREGRGAVAWTPAEVESGEERERERDGSRQTRGEKRNRRQETRDGKESSQSVSQVRASRTAWEWTA